MNGIESVGIRHALDVRLRLPCQDTLKNRSIQA
jgi:hypothetical protein